MSLSSLSTNKFLYKIHRWGGLFIAVFVLFYSLTGILLNHRQSFDFFIEKSSTFHTITPLDATPINTFIDHYKKQINRNDDPKIIRIRQDNAIEFLYGSHGKTTYIITPETGQMETVTKHDSEPFAYFNKLHKASGTSRLWVVLTDAVSLLLIVITLSSLAYLRYKALDFIMIGMGVLFCLLGGFLA
nr:PepSY-associated TM helix domain-containing protein [Desulfobulbaceae bacterium]